MRMVRPFLLTVSLSGLAVMSLAPLTLAPTAAFAQSGPAVFKAPGLIEIVPAGDVIGDGSSPVTLHVLALAPDGSPLTGLKLKPTATLGTVAGWSEVSSGVYAFTYTAPKVAAPTSALVEVKGRTADRVAVNARYKLPVRPATSTGMTVTANPPQLILGQDSEGSISIVLEDAVGNVGAEDIVVRSSTGEVQNLTHLGGGRFSARFVAPRVNYPQLALITATDLRNPDKVFGAIAIPLQGKTDYPVQAAPGASVVLRIGGREYGPVKANAAGSARVPVVVPPGVQSATKVEIRGGQSVEDSIDLRVPETARLSVMGGRRGLPADGVTQIPVRVAVWSGEGKPDPLANVAFTATGGTVSGSRHLGDGLYEALFTPSVSNVPAKATITAALAGSSVQKESVELNLVPARPQAIALTAQPERLIKGATGLKVFAKVTGANSQGLDQRELALSVTGATVKGGVQDLRNGDYRVDFSAAPDSNVDLVATVKNPPTGNPLSHVLLFPQSDVAANDGTSATRITVVTVDEFGFPVPGAEVKLSIETGDGSVQPAVRTNEGGIGQVFYTSGKGSGLVRIRARSGNRTGLVSLVQSSIPDADVPVSGTRAAVDLTNAWDRLVVPLRIPRDGATEGVSGPTDTAAAQAGALARMKVRAEPSTVAAGGKVTLIVDAKDAQGLGVGGLEFDVVASQGEAGAVSDQGGGTYQVEVLVPPTAVGEVKVSVGSGDVASFTRIPISGVAETTAGWGTGDGTADPVAGTGDTAIGNPVVPDPEPSDLTGYSLRVAFLTSGYTYQQAPLDANGPLLDATIAVGGDNGGSAATPQGAEAALEGWFHKFLGFDAQFQGSYWAMTADLFGGSVVRDGLLQVNVDGRVRYPFESGDNVFWVGARVGYHGGDVLYFTGNVDEAQAQFQSLYVQGLGVGGEIGAEVGSIYVMGDISGRFIGVNRFLGVAGNGHIGYNVTDEIFVDAGLGVQTRDVTVIGESSGDELGLLTDSLISGRFGVGLRF